MIEQDNPRRWRPWQFSITTILTLTAFCSVFLAWNAMRQERYQLHSRIQAAEAKAEAYAQIAIRCEEIARLHDETARHHRKIAREQAQISIVDDGPAIRRASFLRREVRLLREQLEQRD